MNTEANNNETETGTHPKGNNTMSYTAFNFEVIVGNIGTVYQGKDKPEALRVFFEYMELSKSGYGRVANEPVTMFDDGEPCHEYEPEANDIRDRIVDFPSGNLGADSLNYSDSIQEYSAYRGDDPTEASLTSFSDYTHNAARTLASLDKDDWHRYYVIPGYISGSDYSGGFVGKANYKDFCELYGEHFDTLNIHMVDGHYSSYGVAIPLTVYFGTSCNLCAKETEEHEGQACTACEQAEAIRETLNALEQYPLIDEETMSNLEMEDWNEQWDSWGRSEFSSELGTRFPELDFDDVEDDSLDSLFHTLCERAGVYPEADGESMYIRMEEVCREVSRVECAILEGIAVDSGLDNEDMEALAIVLQADREAYREGYRYMVIRYPAKPSDVSEAEAVLGGIYVKTNHQCYQAIREAEVRAGLYKCYSYRLEIEPNPTPALPGMSEAIGEDN